MKSLDIRSEPAVRLLAEFLDMDSGGERTNAEHFAHGMFAVLISFFCIGHELPSDARAGLHYHQ